MATGKATEVRSPIPNDSDPIETNEWLESLDYVLENKGSERAQELLTALDEVEKQKQKALKQVMKMLEQQKKTNPEVRDQVSKILSASIQVIADLLARMADEMNTVGRSPIR